MNQKVLNTLEYNKIIELLAAKANSQPGKERFLTELRGMLSAAHRCC